MKYSETKAARIYELLAAGEHTIEDVCKQAGIHKATFYRWKDTNCDFCDLLKKAEEARLASLAHRALSGLAKLLDVYEYEEETLELVDNGQGKPKVKSRKVTKRKVMPNPAAIIYTLNNRAPEQWQQRKHVEVSGQLTAARPDLSHLSDEELAQYLALAAKTQPLALPAHEPGT